jgi:hypothetical protein
MTIGEKKKEYMRKWRSENKERIAASRRAYYSANKERENQYSRNKYWEDPATARERTRCYYENNTERAKRSTIAWQKKNPDRHRKLKRESYWRNVEHCRYKSRAWYADNRERQLQRQKMYYAKNKEANIEYSRRWAEQNPQKVRATKARWKRRNPASVSEYRARRRVWQARSGVAPEQVCIMRCIYKAAARVSKCVAVPFHVDHIFPISRGGAHAPHNLQIIPQKWNLKKSNKLGVELPFN